MLQTFSQLHFELAPLTIHVICRFMIIESSSHATYRLDQTQHTTSIQVLSMTCKALFDVSYTAHTSNVGVAGSLNLGHYFWEFQMWSTCWDEVFSKDPLERYFSWQRHCGRSNETPTAEQAPLNAMTLVQQQAVYQDLNTMNIEQEVSENFQISPQPLRKLHRKV